MLSTRVHTQARTPRQAAQMCKAAAFGFVRSTSLRFFLPRFSVAPRVTGAAAQLHQIQSFSSTPVARLRDFFPARDTTHIKTTKPAWPPHAYTYEEMTSVIPGHREPRGAADWTAWKVVRFARYCMGKATGMNREQQVDKNNPKPLALWPKSLSLKHNGIAGVPGMVGGMLRHLSSLRRMKRDNGWIETLLEESYNERMHLLTFMKMCEPGWFMKVMIIGAQGVFFNGLFICYLLSPKIVHRFVGYLEEEAVHTYTRCIKEIEDGHLPKWSDPNFRIPDIAIQYWNIPEERQTMKDLILYIRADEAVHRGVNHTLGNLDQSEDPNPFVSEFKDREAPKPALHPSGYERADVI
ncbi:Alternative oxidase [Fusarium oxysporum f. sp. raphani]|uniref:Alternative oxidase n=1 Tax=Fusarium oxysporum f. sp. raphani TaxID=96318 RepID=A0A8J5P1X3_FUSOX|nr:Alternative oxidase [Fusarium oxysporum f. sp. raphani]